MIFPKDIKFSWGGQPPDWGVRNNAAEPRWQWIGQKRLPVVFKQTAIWLVREQLQYRCLVYQRRHALRDWIQREIEKYCEIYKVRPVRIWVKFRHYYPSSVGFESEECVYELRILWEPI